MVPGSGTARFGINGVAYAGGSKGSRLGESAVATLPLLAYLMLAAVLMVADHRAGVGQHVRRQLSVLAEPLWWIAALPARLFHEMGDGLTSRNQLQRENRALRDSLRINGAQLNRLQAAALENQRLRGMLGSAVQHRLDVRLADLVDVDLDPYRQRVMIAQGEAQGVRVGQAVMDAGGLLGQVIETSAHRATVLLLTDPDHAVPVQVARSGFRGIAYGGVSRIGHPASLQVPNIPQSADIRKGDVLITSGLGGRFPAGLPVGVVNDLHAEVTGLFIVAEVAPAAHLDRGNQVLLLDEVVEPLAPVASEPPTALDANDKVTTTPSATAGNTNEATPAAANAADKPVPAPANVVPKARPVEPPAQEPTR